MSAPNAPRARIENFALLIFAFGINCFIVFYVAPFPYAVDSYHYIDQALAILKGNWHSYHPNGYPLIIAVFHVVFGTYRDVALVVANCILWSAVTAFVFIIVHRRTNHRRIALLAATLVNFWPAHFILTRSILTEVPAAFFLTMGMGLIWFRHLLPGSLLLGVSIAIRPSLGLVLPLLIAVLWKRDGWKRTVVLLAISMLPQICISAYAITRPTEVRQPSLLAEVIARAQLYPPNDPSFTLRKDTTAFQELRRYTQDLVADPGRYVIRRLLYLNEMWGPWPFRHRPRDEGPQTSVIRNAMLGLQFPLFVFAMLALAIKRDRWTWFAAAPAIALTIFHVPLFGYPRYNFPAIPLLAILAAETLLILWPWSRKGLAVARPKNELHNDRAPRP